MKILIIGGGWFGNYLAYKLSKIGDVKLIEKNSEIMQEASKWNQRRLHLGFHYPRSLETILQTKDGYSLFKKEFPSFTRKINNNIYAIANSSCVSAVDYMQTYKDLNIPFKILSKDECVNFGFRNISLAMRVDEEEIDYLSAFNFFKEKNRHITILNSKVKQISFNDKKLFTDKHEYCFDFLINTTYTDNNITSDRNHRRLDLKYEFCTIPLYHNYSKNKIFKSFSYTVMDGDFCSLYPFDRDLFSLTSVKYTPVIRMNELEFRDFSMLDSNAKREIANYHYMNNGSNEIFEECLYKYINNINIKYIDNQYITKVKFMDDLNDRRDTKILFNENYITIYPGKIDSIQNTCIDVINYLK